jgi:hypothetical protein
MRASLLIVGSALALAACGGGSSSSTPGSVPRPQTTPPAPLTPPAAGTSFDTTEFRYNYGLAAVKPVAAYEKGATGKGVVLGILDTGINLDNPEFPGRLHPASADFLDGGTLRDRDGHGTIVSSVIAGARNSSDGHGVAFEATLFMGRILNSYSPDVGRTQAQIQSDNIAFYNGFANGTDAARLAGVRSINLSIGFGEAKVSDPNTPPPPRGPLDDAFDRTIKALQRAQADGVIYVVAAGNEGAARPNAFARILLPTNNARVPVLIVGAVDANNNIASFSNRAGSGTDAQYFLVAPGVRIRARDEAGGDFLYSGTSLAAPFVNGALGLLLQAFPNLTGQQAVDLLLRTATDLGAPGFDDIYGNGLLNIENAFKPQGQQSLALGATSVGLPVDAPLANLGGAFGSGMGLRQSLASLTFLDSYGRAFSGDFSGSLRSRASSIGLHSLAAVRQDFALSTLATGGMALQFSGRQAPAWQRDARGQTGADTRLTDVRMNLHLPLSARLRLSAGSGVSADELLGTGDASDMLLLDDARLLQADPARPDVSLGVTRLLANWSLSAAMTYGRKAIVSPARQSARSASSFDVRARRWLGDTDVTLGLSFQSERGQLLGSDSHILFGDDAGSHGLMAQLGLQRDLGPLHLSATSQLGRVQLNPGSAALAQGSNSVTLSAFRALVQYDVRQDARLSFALAQPLRIESGAATLRLPTGYDYATLQSRLSDVRTTLAPDARELDLELGFAGRIGPFEHVQLNGFHRLNPGHQSDVPSDTGLLLRWQTRF